MSLTPSQLATLKAYILATPALAAVGQPVAITAWTIDTNQ